MRAEQLKKLQILLFSFSLQDAFMTHDLIISVRFCLLGNEFEFCLLARQKYVFRTQNKTFRDFEFFVAEMQEK